LAKVDGVALIFLAADIDGFLRALENGAWVEDGYRGKTDIDDESVEFAGVGDESVSIGLVSGVGDIGSDKFEPGGRSSEESLVGDETVEFSSASGQDIELGGKVSGDQAGGGSRGGNNLLGVVLVYISTNNWVRGGDNTVVVDDAAYKFVQVSGQKVIGSTLVNNDIGSIDDKLGETTSLVSGIRAVDGNDGFGNDSSVDNFGKVGSSPASTSGDYYEVRVGNGIDARGR